MGRAIADMPLARSENSSHRFYFLSAQSKKERKSFYAILEKTQKDDLDITPWIKWFLDALGQAIESALLTLDVIVDKSDFWKELKDVYLNERQRKVINRLLDGFE